MESLVTLPESYDVDAAYDDALVQSLRSNTYHEHIDTAEILLDPDSNHRVVVFHLDAATLPADCEVAAVLLDIDDTASCIVFFNADD